MRILTIFVTACMIPVSGLPSYSASPAGPLARRVSAASGRDDKADQILRQMHERARKLTTVQASIVQVKRQTQIGRKEVYAGYLYFRHAGPNKDKIRITYKSGGEITNDLLIDGDKIILYQPKIKQAIISSRTKQAAENPEYDFLAAPYGSVPNLKSRYATAYLRDEPIGSFATSVIQLTPIGKSSFTQITFWVDQGSRFPVQYQVDETNGDVTTITLSDIRRNAEVRGDAFRLDLPKGTKIITR